MIFFAVVVEIVKVKQNKIELELEKGVTMTPKRRSILSALFFYLFLS